MTASAAALALNRGKRLMTGSMQEKGRYFRQKTPRARSHLSD
jgi:hypothetical protein